MYQILNDAEWLLHGIRCEELEVWIGRLLALCDLAVCQWHFLWGPAPERRFLPSGRYIEVQIGDKNFEHDNSPGFFVPVTRSEGAFLYTCLGALLIVLFRRHEKRLAKTLTLEEVKILLNSVFNARGYLQHAGGDWWDRYCLRDQMDLIPEVKLKDTIAFAYGSGLNIKL